MESDKPAEEAKKNDEILEMLKGILAELKEINTSLKSIARSQAQQATMQKATVSRRSE